MEPGGQFDFQQLLAAAAEMQNQLMNASQELAEAEIGGSAGSGLVRVTINGQGELIDVVIGPAAIDPGNAEDTAATIADLVLAACRDAYRQLEDVQAEKMGPLAGAFGAATGQGGGGAGLPGLPSLPGFPGTLGQSPIPGAVVPDEGGPSGQDGPEAAERDHGQS